MAYPYLKWVTSKCCYGLPFMKPVEAEGGEGGANVGEEDGSLLNPGNSAEDSRNTYVVNGKEYKKRSKKTKKKHSEKAEEAEPLA